MVVEIMAPRCPAAVCRKPLVTLELTHGKFFVAKHAQVRLQVDPATKHVNMLVVAGGAGEYVDPIAVLRPARIAELLRAMDIFCKFGFVAAIAGLVGDRFKALVTRSTGFFEQVVADRGFTWQKDLLLL